MTDRGEWNITGPKDPQRVRPDWSAADVPAISGVVFKAIDNVVAQNGYLTEIWRPQWETDDRPVGQVFQRVFDAGGASSWHAHARTTDRVFCAVGRVLLALYDSRRDSPTFNAVAIFRLGAERPAMIVVPPGVWHALRNIGGAQAAVINVVDTAYDYADPDVFRLPLDTPLIPYSV